MKGSKLSGTLECWREAADGSSCPFDVSISLHVFPVHPSDGGGYEVDVLEATAGGQPFHVTDAEVDRAVAQFSECEP